MERNNAIFTYDITNPADPFMTDYFMPASEHNSTEGLEFISASESPNGRDLLVVAYEMTGTVQVLEVR